MDWELTDEEKAWLRDRLIDEFSEEGLSFLRTIDGAAQAQVKKLVEWLDGQMEYVQGVWVLDATFEGWEELKRQVGLE